MTRVYFNLRLKDRQTAALGAGVPLRSNVIHAPNSNPAIDGQRRNKKGVNTLKSKFFLILYYSPEAIVCLFLPGLAQQVRSCWPYTLCVLWNFAISHLFTPINMSARQILLHLSHLSIKAILILTLKYNFLAGTRSRCSPSQCILAGHDSARTSWPTLSFTASVCSHPPRPTPGHETMAATLKVSINHPQRRFAFLKDFFRWCKCATRFIFKSHLAGNVSSNGQWNDKFRKAKKPVVMIHLLRSVKNTLKLLKLTAPHDKTRSEWAGYLSRRPTGTFFSL